MGVLVVGQWCIWIYDGDLGHLHGVYGTMDAELEERAQLTAFLCLLKKVIGPFKVHVDNKEMDY